LIAENAQMDTVLDAVRVSALGDAVTIQFGDGGVLDLGEMTVLIKSELEMVPEWGEITLTGSIKKTRVTTTQWGSTNTEAICISSYQQAPRLIVNSTANIENTVGDAISGSAVLTITGGNISTVNGYSVNAFGDLTVTGGNFASTIYTNKVNAVFTGGTFNGLTVYGGSASISGTAEFISNSSYGTVYLHYSASANNGSIKISGGKITNTAEERRAIIIGNATSTLTLSGAPQITGSIATEYAGRIAVDGSFSPGTNRYALDVSGSARTAGAVAVVGGGAHLGSFSYGSEYYELAQKGDDIVVSLKGGATAPKYTVTNAGTGFKVTKDGNNGTMAELSTVTEIFSAIRTDADAANGGPCAIAFGSGATALNISEAISFNGWGAVSLSGKLVSSQDMTVSNTTVESSADMEMGRPTGITISAVSHFTINGGTINKEIRNNAGTVTIAGGNIFSIKNNGGRLTITGGTVGSAALTDYGAIQNNNGGEVTISGTANIGSAAVAAINSNDRVATIVSQGGGASLVITGGKIWNSADSGAAIANLYSSYNPVGFSNAVISGTAEITSVNPSSTYGTIDNNGIMEISGGTIKADSGVCAVVAYSGMGGMTTIYGTANITSSRASATSGTIVVSGGIDALHLLGGTISNTADGGNAFYGSYSCGFTIGGSPTINGDISCNITVLASGDSAFAPGDNTYNLAGIVTEALVMVTNGARFTPNFVLDPTGNANFKLAASGNDIVATALGVYSVDFSINGAAGAPPAAIPVLRGGTLGELAKPSTRPYVSQGGFANDGEWYLHTGTFGGVEGVGSLFDFGVGVAGTPINGNTTLILKWTDKISVLEAVRDVPIAQKSEAVIVAPVPAGVGIGLFTAGPNPVARHAGSVGFFWGGLAVRSGKLFIYDASGNLVKKIAIRGAAGSAGGRSIASWDLTDAKGRPAAGGAYVAKGVIEAKSGKPEKVSALFSVR
jgi:hypothetical protein